MSFNLDAARKAGKNDEEIASYLGQTLGFDVEAAKRSGKTSTQIAEYLAVNERPREEKLPTIKNRETKTLEESTKAYAELEGKPLITPNQQSRMVRPVLETTGAIGGGIVAAPFNIIAPGVSEVAGTALGYMTGKKAADIYEEFKGIKKPQGIKEALQEQVTTTLPEGLIMGLAGPATSKTIEALGSAAKSIWGALTGTGKASIEEAIKSGQRTGITAHLLESSTPFDRAMRGEITNKEVVEHARNALINMRDLRAANYRTELANLSQNKTPINITSLKQEFKNELKKFAKIDPQGNPIWDRSTFGSEEGVNKIKAIKEKFDTWGRDPEDNTPLGLDMLKRHLDNFYSDSSDARALVANMRNKVKNIIIKNVPEYKAMMKDYEESTILIKDIESDLMMRKQGMTGRITADQTLRRMILAMRDNYPLRRDLVQSLSIQGKQDIMGEVAGMAMNTFIPRGLAGTGPALLGEAALAKFVTPKLWPVLAASSPRLTGEFLRLYGKGLVELQGTAPMFVKGLMTQELPQNISQGKEESQ